MPDRRRDDTGYDRSPIRPVSSPRLGLIESDGQLFKVSTYHMNEARTRSATERRQPAVEGSK